MRATMTTKAAALMAVALLGACSQIKTNQGYIIDDPLLASVQPGIDNKDSVQKVLGRPTFTGEFSANDWYYVSRNTKQLAFLRPKPEKQSIIKIVFDARGNVAKVERRGLEEVVAVSPSSDKTPTLGRDTGILEDLFGGIGRLGTAPTNDSAGGTGSGGRDGPK